jgi:phage tail sheath protein FI
MRDTDDSSFLSDAGIETNTAVNPVHPILRGVLMTPSGVVATLKQTGSDSAEPTTGPSDTGGVAGGTVGSVNITIQRNQEFILFLNGHKPTAQYSNFHTASFNNSNASYMTKVLNTDPTKIQEAGHYLYADYAINSSVCVVTGTAGNNTVLTSSSGSWVDDDGSYMENVALLLTSSQDRNVGTTTIPNYEGFQDRYSSAFSPWVISQKFGSTYKNLFKIHSLTDGAASEYQYRVEISNIVAGPKNTFGKFDVRIVEVKEDVDPNVAPTLFTFAGCDLDPSSDNYIARKIGDTNAYYDFDQNTGNQRLVIEGTYANTQNLVRVVMHPDVTNRNIDVSTLPMGYRGPYHLVTSGSDIFPEIGTTYIATSSISRMTTEPPHPLRQNIWNGTDAVRVIQDLPWGFVYQRAGAVSNPNSNSNFDPSVTSFFKHYSTFQTVNQSPWVGNNAGEIDSGGTVYDSDRFNNNLFTLERLQILTQSAVNEVYHESAWWSGASYRRTGVLSASLRDPEGNYHSGRFLDPSKDFGIIDARIKFTFPVQGGFDGTNIFDAEKKNLTNLATVREMEDENQGQANGPTVKAYFKALGVMAEKSDVDVQVLAIPGIRETKITDQAVLKTEDRFDAIYIMDIEQKNSLNNIITGSSPVNVTNTMNNMRNRGLNTSFAASYFPDVIMNFKDKNNQNITVTAPPSVAVIGAYSLNDSVSHPWFAPAGFSRGILPKVTSADVLLTRNMIDASYQANVNPIVKFASINGTSNSGGPVIYGQKTLQAVASSLDRVNVRRLLIDIRRKVRNIANTFIFEPNRAETLARFSAAVEPIMSTIQSQQGVDRYRVLIDTTTTTQADVENNTIRGKIFLQPTRSLEFISLDFVVSNTGE